MGGKETDFDAIAVGERELGDAVGDESDDQSVLVETSGPVPAAELDQRRDYQTELSSRHHRWKLRLFWVRYPGAFGVGLVWLGLTALLVKEIGMLLVEGFDAEPYALAGLFAAWLGLTVTIHKSLSPERPTKSTSGTDVFPSLPPRARE